MVESTKKAIGFVKVPFLLSRESQTPIERDTNDAIEVCRAEGIKYFGIPIMPYREINPEEVQIEEYVQWKTLPHLIPRKVQSLEGITVFLRSWAHAVPSALNAITAIGGKNELSMADHNRVLAWPSHVGADYTHRRVGIMPLSEVAQSADQYALQGDVFIKTADKLLHGHGTVVQLEEVLRTAPREIPYLCDLDNTRKVAPLGPETPIILSQPISFEKDSDGSLEYRVWIFNRNVLVAHRYGDPGNLAVPEMIKQFSQSFVESHKEKFPAHYVLDVGIANKVGPVVVEMNDITYSGNMGPNIFRAISNAFFKGE